MDARIVIFLFDLLARLPLRVVHYLGTLLGWATYLLSASYASRLRENLSNFNAGSHSAGFRSVLHASVAEAGKGMIEMPWIWRRPVVDVLAKVRNCYGREYLDKAQQSGKGVIFLTPHIGCFELTGLYLAAEMSLTIMYSTPKKAWLDEVIRGGRQRGKIILARADIGGVRTLFKSLKRGEAIGLLPDQVPAHGEGEWEDFFGRKAYSMTLAGRLQASSGALVVLTYAVRRPHGEGYDVHFLPMEVKEGIPFTRQINRELEKIIRSCPAQYLWSYNRYKAPPGSLPDVQNKE